MVVVLPLCSSSSSCSSYSPSPLRPLPGPQVRGSPWQPLRSQRCWGPRPQLEVNITVSCWKVLFYNYQWWIHSSRWVPPRQRWPTQQRGWASEPCCLHFPAVQCCHLWHSYDILYYICHDLLTCHWFNTVNSKTRLTIVSSFTPLSSNSILSTLVGTVNSVLVETS